jgi:hypothetical protein
MSCNITPIPSLNVGYCELKDKVNEVVAGVNANCAAIADKGIRLAVLGTGADNDNISNSPKNIFFSSTPFDPLNGYSENKRYTVQSGDSGLFMIIGQVGVVGQATGSTFYELNITKNSISLTGTTMALFPNLMQHSLQIITVVELVAGDFIEMAILGNATDILNVIGVQNNIKITKL